MTSKDAAKIGATVIAVIITPAIAPDVLRWIRVTFDTVGIQDPITEYSGDISFYLVLTTWFLLPFILAFAFNFRGIPAWAAILPWGVLISSWLVDKSNIEANDFLFWSIYFGYFTAAIGLAAPKPVANRWNQIAWIPPMLFLATQVMWHSWWAVFFE